MKRSLLILAFLFSFVVRSQVLWQFNCDTVITWHYQEGDEFNDEHINTDYWRYVLWSRSLYMNKEQQYYTDGENVKELNGTVQILAKKENVFKRTIDGQDDNDSLMSDKKFVTLNKTNFNYTSGKLTTRHSKFNKGYYECRFKVPSSKGYWPAFWLHGGSPNEEIDIMEAKSSKPTQIHVDTHCPDKCDLVWNFIKQKSFGDWIKTRTNLVEGFNVMSCEWSEDHVKFYLNGEFIAVSKVKFDIPKHMTINMAVPSDNGPFGPGPSPEDSLAVFEVDYVRVWSKNNSDSKIPGIEESFNTLDTIAPISKRSLLPVKRKSFYGSKKLAKNEGIKISMFRTGNNFQFSVLGNVRENKPAIMILDSAGKDLYSTVFDRTNKSIDLGFLKKGNYTLKLSWGNKNTSYPILIN